MSADAWTVQQGWRTARPLVEWLARHVGAAEI